MSYAAAPTTDQRSTVIQKMGFGARKICRGSKFSKFKRFPWKFQLRYRVLSSSNRRSSTTVDAIYVWLTGLHTTKSVLLPESLTWLVIIGVKISHNNNICPMYLRSLHKRFLEHVVTEKTKPYTINIRMKTSTRL